MPSRSVSLVALVMLAALSCTEGARKPPATVGGHAPEYSARSLAGDSVSLAALEGKVVLLNIWATWCHPCRDEIPLIEAMHQKHARDGLAVVGVSVDGDGSDAAIRDMIRDFGMTYTVWVDPADKVSAKFMTLGVPETFIIDRGGIVRWRKIGVIEPNDPRLDSVVTALLKS